jgi:hypothetical protein
VLVVTEVNLESRVIQSLAGLLERVGRPLRVPSRRLRYGARFSLGVGGCGGTNKRTVRS